MADRAPPSPAPQDISDANRQPERRPTHDAGASPDRAGNALQRLADQSSKTAKLQQLQKQADEAPASQALQQLQAAANQTIQRVPKVGFEMEDAHWRSWKQTWRTNPFAARRYVDKDHKNGIRPATRKELLHTGTGFNLEADGFTVGGEKLADIEFVTAPFPLTEAGFAALTTAMTDISAIYERISGFAGRNHATGGFVTQGQHHLNQANVALSMGEENANLNLQATSGLALEDIPRVFSAMTTNTETVATHAPEAYMAIQFGNTRHADFETSAPMRPISESPRRAFFFCLNYLEDHLPEETAATIEEHTPPLLGFVTALIGFLQAMNPNYSPVICFRVAGMV